MPGKSKSGSPTRKSARKGIRNSLIRARLRSDPAVSYDDFKSYEGQRYTGMKVGRSHKWHYDPGVWRETKITPDLWEISYAVNKRRAGKAPEGSGVPVGTEYHWYVLAHQNVRKLNANDYTTSLAGTKFKIAHRRADSEKWSATAGTQRNRMIKFLQDVIRELQQETPAEMPETVSAAAERAKRRKQSSPPSARERGWRRRRSPVKKTT